MAEPIPQTLPRGLPASAYALGTPTAVFTARGAGCFLLGAAAFVLLVGLAFVGLGCKVLADAQASAGEKGLGAAVALLVGVPILVAGWQMRRRVTNLGTMRAWVMPQGLAWKSNASKGAARWDDVVKLYVKRVDIYRNGSLVRETARYTLVDKTGQQALFSEFMPGVRDLARTLEEQVSRRALPVARQQFLAGEPVCFDALRVDARGLHHGKHSVRWEDVEGLAVQDGAVVLLQGGKPLPWTKVLVAEVPNFAVFTALVEAQVAARTPGPPPAAPRQ